MSCEEELATTVASMRSGTQRALQHIVTQYRSRQRELCQAVKGMLKAAAYGGEDYLEIRQTQTMFEQISKSNVPNVNTRTPYYKNNVTIYAPNPDDYHKDCFTFGRFLHPERATSSRPAPTRREWARKLYESVQQREELRALQLIAQELSIDMHVEYTANKERIYVFNWAESASQAYYTMTEGRVDVLGQYEVNESTL